MYMLTSENAEQCIGNYLLGRDDYIVALPDNDNLIAAVDRTVGRNKYDYLQLS